jgi:polar amino acid transport system substrate-binding protein
MKKYIILGVGLFFISLFSDVWSQKINIATDNWPPYEFVEGVEGNQYISGFSTEVVMEVLKKMEVEISSIKSFPWVRGEMMLISGEVDVLLSGVYSSKRAEDTFYPGESLVESSWAFFIRREDRGRLKYENLDDLKGHKIGIVRAYAYPKDFIDFIKKENNSEEVGENLNNLKKLLIGRIDYVVMDYNNGRYLLKKEGVEDKIILLPNRLSYSSLYAIFSKNSWIDQEFVDKFSLELVKFKKTLEYRKIYSKYLSE